MGSKTVGRKGGRRYDDAGQLVQVADDVGLSERFSPEGRRRRTYDPACLVFNALVRLRLPFFGIFRHILAADFPFASSLGEEALRPVHCGRDFGFEACR
jgi:hypothetical protein